MRTRILVVTLAMLLSGSTLTSLESRAGATINTPRCDGRPATIFGRTGTIVGTSGADVIVGSASDDVIKGNGGNDVICGGPGDDRIFGEAGADRLFGDHGDFDDGLDDDVVKGGPGDDYIFDLEASSVWCENAPRGRPGDYSCGSGQRLDGDAGSDEFHGSGILHGGAGDDTIDLFFGAAHGGSGNDAIATTHGWILRGGSGDDSLRGDHNPLLDRRATLLDGGSGPDTCNPDATDLVIACRYIV